MFKQNKNNQFSLNLENKLNHEKNNFLVSKCNKKAAIFAAFFMGEL